MRKHSNGLAALLFLASCATPQVPPAPRPGPIAGSNGDVPGYQHGGTEVSKFVTGDHTEWIFQHGYIRQAGDEGTIAISAGNGSVFSVPNATASALRSPAYGASPQDHERYVRDYFVGRGLPASQVKNARTMTLLEATGRADEINNTIPRLTAYYSVLERDIDGVAVPDSFAWARVNTDGRVVQEGVYWPSLPATAVADAMKLRDLLARPATRRALSARLPVDAASGVVTIRHSSANEDEFEAFASLDVAVHVPAPSARAAANYRPLQSIAGGPVVVRHFDVNGQERLLPQERLNLRDKLPATGKELQ